MKPSYGEYGIFTVFGLELAAEDIDVLNAMTRWLN